MVCGLLLAAALFATEGGLLASAPEAPPYRIVVNPSNPVSSVGRAFVGQAFLKKVRQWPDGGTIDPVDLPESSPVRARWTSDVLNRSVEAVRSYWQQRIFSGRDLPPPEMRSDDEVIVYVLRTPGAIGYVGGGANLRGAKVLAVR